MDDNYFFKNEGLLKATASHAQCKCVDISETVAELLFTTQYDDIFACGQKPADSPLNLNTRKRKQNKYKTSTAVFKDGRISTHADPTSTRLVNLRGMWFTKA